MFLLMFVRPQGGLPSHNAMRQVDIPQPRGRPPAKEADPNNQEEDPVWSTLGSYASCCNDPCFNRSILCGIVGQKLIFTEAEKLIMNTTLNDSLQDVSQMLINRFGTFSFCQIFSIRRQSRHIYMYNRHL